MTDLILHHYDASPFTQKALLMLGIKGAAWRSVETPMMPPKDDLVALTGGYRGTPVLQIGADVYIDSQRIARELERRQPMPRLLPDGVAGLGLMLVTWSDAFFRCGLYRAIHQTAAQWDASFLDDRKRLFPDVDFTFDDAHAAHRTGQFQAHVALIDLQLADGRRFLMGDAPTLADVQAWPFLWMARGLADTADLLAGFERVAAWEERVAAIGEGTRTVIDAQEAFAAAHAIEPEALPAADHRSPAPDAPLGSAVIVEPDDTRRGGVHGTLLRATPLELTVAREHERCGRVHVHFPRLGYRIRPATG